VKAFLERLGGLPGAAVSVAVIALAPLLASGAAGLDRAAALSAVGGVLALGAVAVGIACRGRPGSGSVSAAIVLGLLGLVCGSAAALVPAMLAPRGLDPAAVALLLVGAISAAGLVATPRGRMLWWAPCGIGLGFAAWIGFCALPAWPSLAGFERPPEGSDVEVAWSASGAWVSIVYPLDEPVAVRNGVVVRPGLERATARLAASGASCADADGEERAAAEAVVAGDQGQAIARARLALQICAGATYAREALGSSLLARGVTRMRSGATDDALADLEEALGLLGRDEDLARAHLALGRTLESAARADEARAHFERAAELAPSHPAGRAAAAKLRLALH